MQAADEGSKQKMLQLGELSRSAAGGEGDDQWQAMSDGLPQAEGDAAAAADPSQPSADTSDLHQAKAASADESGDAGAAAVAADAVLGSTGSTAAPGASSGCAQDSAEGNNPFVQVPFLQAWSAVYAFSLLRQLGSAR